jgi:hypothetical protein
MIYLPNKLLNKMKKALLFVLVILSVCSLFAQTKFRSNKHYTLIIPEGYEHVKKIGNNVDLKLLNKKNKVTFNCVASALTEDEKGKTVYEITKISPSVLMNALSEYIDNPKFIKYGNTTIGNVKAVYIQFSSGNSNRLYNISYYVYYKGQGYVFTAACLFENIDELKPEIYNIFRSIKFN